jgi:putative ABC transport system permease protein
MIQSLLLAVVAALLAVPLALVLRLGMPMPSTLSVDSLVKIVLVGILVGVVSSLAAVRRALTTDPALAFGAA